MPDGPKSSGEANEPLDAAARAALKAIVLDTNVYGHGRPNLPSLKDLAARSSQAGLEVWVHELVASEWAQHLADDIIAYNQQTKTVAKFLGRAHLDTDLHEPLFDDAPQVIAAFFEQLHAIPDINIVPLSPDAARLGLLDQVLLTGPAKRKEGVKTGASDSAWVRDVVTQADGDITRLMIVTSDRKDVTAAFKAVDPTYVPQTRTLYQLPAAIFAFGADPGLVTTMLARELLRLVPPTTPETSFNDIRIDYIPFDIGYVENLDHVLRTDDRWPYHSATTAEVSSIDAIVATTSVATEPPRDTEVTGTREVRTGSATVWMLVTVDAVSHSVSTDGEIIESITSLPGIPVVAQMSFDVVDNAVHDIRGAGSARALPRERFSDPDEAFYSVNEMLDAIGIEPPEPWFTQTAEIFTTHVAGVELTIQFDGDLTSEFTVHLETETSSATIACVYDDSAFVGGSREGIYVVPPYELYSEDHHRTRFDDGGWRAIATVLAAIAGTTQ